MRDYFAGQALIGLLANPEGSASVSSEYAKDAYYYADEMLKARIQK
jgi:hypothetical protein